MGTFCHPPATIWPTEANSRDHNLREHDSLWVLEPSAAFLNLFFSKNAADDQIVFNQTYVTFEHGLRSHCHYTTLLFSNVHVYFIVVPIIYCWQLSRAEQSSQKKKSSKYSEYIQKKYTEIDCLRNQIKQEGTDQKQVLETIGKEIDVHMWAFLGTGAFSVKTGMDCGYECKLAR